MAVLNSSHRQAILNKARTTTASTNTVDFDDFDNLLGDLSSAIADLESITAVSVFVCVCDLFCLHNSLLCSLFNLSSSPCLPPSLPPSFSLVGVLHWLLLVLIQQLMIPRLE